MAQGLAIDDFFAVSVESKCSENVESRSKACYDLAQAAYAKHSLLGSPHKDIVAENTGKVVGGWINSGADALSRSIVTLASPPEKRLAMSFLTLELCRLSHTTDSLHLCLLGGWVSILTYRRPLMSILQSSFHLVDQYAMDPNNPVTVPLPRKVAEELVLLSVLCPLALSELSAVFHPYVYATDASSHKGAICRSLQPPEVVRTLWKSCKSKGAYTRLLTSAEITLRRLEIMEETGGKTRGFDSPDRPLAFSFEFLEVFGGSAKITSFLDELGFICGPPIELSLSEEFNLQYSHVQRWITYLLSSGRLKAVAAEPPCTTFSIMRRPRLRSRLCPYGFSVIDEKTAVGNALAHRAFQLLAVADRFDAVAVMENPFSSYMRHLPSWQAISGLSSAMEVRCDSCRFGSDHLKPFRFLGVNIDLSRVALRCVCSGRHVQVQGSLTKQSAVYSDDLARTLAKCIGDAITSMKNQKLEELTLDTKGLENQLVNEVALSSKWEKVSSWTFKKESHINILEEASLLRLVHRLGALCQSARVVNFVDSFVVRGATSKGRSASLGLGAVLRRVCAAMVSSCLYFTLPFVPTRHNVSDDPTRDVEVRGEVPGLGIDSWTEEELLDLALVPPTRRWASNWLRLLLKLSGPSALRFLHSSEKRWLPRREWKGFPRKKFDSTLGFPGEGPSLSFFTFGCFLGPLFHVDFVLGNILFYVDFVRRLVAWISFNVCFVSAYGLLFLPALALSLLGAVRSVCRCCLVVLLMLLFAPGANAMPLWPRTPGEQLRAERRILAPAIPEGRPVLERTSKLRDRYFDIFLAWTVEQGLDFRSMLADHYSCIDDINLVLVHFGRSLYSAGKTYAQFAETLNALTSTKPALRRMIQGAWDFGYAWNRAEPVQHHVAAPFQVVLAVISVSLLWGWLPLAGTVALMFGGLLRPGELLAARREDLLLPRDCDASIPFCLLSIKDPKSRFTNARHQSVKVDAPDLLRVIQLAFGKLEPGMMLWPFSPQTLRNRFKSVLEALHVPVTHTDICKCLDLGSLRAGGATWILQVTEDGDLLQRRGRWANRKMMDIYVQEVQSLIYLKKISDTARRRVFTLSSVFLQTLGQAEHLEQFSIPCNLWRFLFSK